MFAKVIIVLFLLIIFFCLGSALYYLLHDKEGSTRMVKALTARITLSLILFFLLLLGFATGILHPNHVVLFS